MQNRIIAEIVDSLRDTLHANDAFLVALQLLAWAKVSSTDKVSKDLRLTAHAVGQPALALETMAKLESETKGIQRHAFADMTRLERLDPARLTHVLDLVLRSSAAGMLNNFEPTDLAGLSDDAEGTIPSAVVTLLVGLAGICGNDSVYNPWDQSGQLAVKAARAGGSVYVEAPSTTVAAAIGLLADTDFELHRADPISGPSMIKDGVLRQFDVAIAFPPLGIKYKSEIATKDWFGRFPERTASGVVLSVRHLLAQTQRKIVIAIQNNLLFSSGAERSLREELLRRRCIQAVIAMPSGLLSNSNVSFSLLVLNPSGGQEKIRFVNLDAPQFTKALSKAKVELHNVPAMIDLVQSDQTTGDALSVPTADVLANDTQLQVNRYVLPETTRKLQTLLANTRTTTLGELVTTVRPMSVSVGDDAHAIDAFEVGVTDLPPYGYIPQASRPVKLDRYAADKNKQQFLRGNDIVLIVKGSVGKVGIVPMDVPRPGPGGWIAGQSAIVLRAQSPEVSPCALTIQLRSPIGQELLKSITSGATVPLIQLKELTHLTVLVPDANMLQQTEMAFEREVELQRQIEQLCTQQKQLTKDIWALDGGN
tara:strand:+ start:15483 stop:17261 length:1779 start_codon:yes stop_codon:yes gene_type:complete